MTLTSKSKSASKSASASCLGSAALAAFAVWSASAARVAWALCPNCLAQQSTLTPTLKLIGLFLIVPFAVAAAVYLVVRRAVHGRPNPSARAPGTHAHEFRRSVGVSVSIGVGDSDAVPDRLADADADADADRKDTMDGQRRCGHCTGVPDPPGPTRRRAS